MREILFRGKLMIDCGDYKKGEWVYGTPVADGKGCHIVKGVAETTCEYFQPEEWYVVDPETVGQFTGLTDKNGVKIFVGDFVRVDSRKFPIVVLGGAEIDDCKYLIYRMFTLSVRTLKVMLWKFDETTLEVVKEYSNARNLKFGKMEGKE